MYNRSRFDDDVIWRDMMRKGYLALFLMLLMVGIGFVALVNVSDSSGVDPGQTPGRAVTQRLDDYRNIQHSAWDLYDHTEPWNQQWHNWSNYLQYYPQREFWLSCKNVSIYEPPPEYTWLDDVNSTTNGEEVFQAKEDLNETRKYDKPMNFTYPRADKALTAKYDTSMNDIGICNLTIGPLGQFPQLPFQNPLMGSEKELNVEVWVDTDGDYIFETGSGRIEGIMRFDFNWWDTPYDPTNEAEGFGIEPYVTKNTEFMMTLRQMEEHADGIGYWLDLEDADSHPDIPGDITGGRIWVVLYRTDNNPDDIDGTHPVTGDFWPAWRTPDMFIYCGYNHKMSWLTIPYLHPEQRPVAEAGEDKGFPANRDNFMRDKSDPYYEDPVFDEDNPQIKEGEIIRLEGYRSYDPQDDVGRDGIGYGDPAWTGEDAGEGNGNIDDGKYLPGEQDLGETDTLFYKWSAYIELGESKFNLQITSGWIDTPVYDWKVKIPSMDPNLPADEQYMIVKVILTVLDKDRLQNTDSFLLLAYKSQNAPRVSIAAVPQIPNLKELQKQGIDVSSLVGQAWILPEQEITFEGYAYDPDPNSDLTYIWEFIGPYGSKTIPDSPTVTDYFDEPADWTISLTVYDGEIDNINTLSDTATMTLHVVENIDPVPIVRARLTSLQEWQYGMIETSKGRMVTFNGTESFDPDINVSGELFIGMPGFDNDGDKVPDEHLKFQWDWGDGSRTEGWSSNPQAEHSWIERGARQFNRQYWPVKLMVWDGGETPAESLPFKVYVNMPPTARASFVKPDTLENYEAGMEVTFDGSASYDPNDDPNYDQKRDKDPEYDDSLIYIWDFGDGSPQMTSNAGVPTITHVYKNPSPSLDKPYRVRLTVTDGTFQDDDTVDIYIAKPNLAPLGVMKIEAGSWISKEPYRVYTLIPITFDCSESYDPDGENYLDDKLETKPIDDMKTILWDLGDGNASNQERIIHTYDKVGVYTVKLNMTDFKGAIWEGEAQIEVVNRKPVAVVKKDKETLGIDEQPVLLSAEGSYDEDGTIIGYYWEFGDGTFSDKTKGIDGYVPGVVVNHKYEKTGRYEAKLYVMDNNQETSPTGATVTVVITATEDPNPTPVGTGAIVGGIVAGILIIGILSTLGAVSLRKRT